MSGNFIPVRKKMEKKLEEAKERKINTNQSKMKGKTQVLIPTVNEMNLLIERQSCSNWTIQNLNQKSKQQKFQVCAV